MYSANFGTIKSPLNPLDYPNNARCTYVISGAPGANVVLEFHAFETEDQKDFVNLYDGTTVNSKSLAK